MLGNEERPRAQLGGRAAKSKRVGRERGSPLTGPRCLGGGKARGGLQSLLGFNYCSLALCTRRTEVCFCPGERKTRRTRRREHGSPPRTPWQARSLPFLDPGSQRPALLDKGRDLEERVQQGVCAYEGGAGYATKGSLLLPGFLPSRRLLQHGLARLRIKPLPLPSKTSLAWKTHALSPLQGKTGVVLSSTLNDCQVSLFSARRRGSRSS